jgi:hypothetical protein
VTHLAPYYYYYSNRLQPVAVDDPRTLIDLYKQAAINAKEAGFDGVEREQSTSLSKKDHLSSLCFFILQFIVRAGISYISSWTPRQTTELMHTAAPLRIVLALV